jgi:hypothetical protein
LSLALGGSGRKERLRLLEARALHIPAHHAFSKGINLFARFSMRMQKQGNAGVGARKVF